MSDSDFYLNPGMQTRCDRRTSGARHAGKQTSINHVQLGGRRTWWDISCQPDSTLRSKRIVKPPKLSRD